MTRILDKIFSGGPFSAVRPYLGDTDQKFEPEPPAMQEPQDGFQQSETEAPSRGAPSTEHMRKGSARSGAQAALHAFPQVVHLLVDPDSVMGENLSKEVGLPLITLQDGNVDRLEKELDKPEYSNGFILEGFPTDTAGAEKLDGLLGNVAPESRRVLGWELSSETHQEILDHYVDKDLLWMVPESSDPSNAQEAKQGMLSCLQGLPVLN